MLKHLVTNIPNQGDGDTRRRISGNENVTGNLTLCPRCYPSRESVEQYRPVVSV